MALFLAVCACIVWLLLEQRAACVDGGGVYVRGPFAFECIKGSP